MVVALRHDAGAVDVARVAAVACDRAQLLFFRLTALRELGRRKEDAARDAVRACLLDPHPEVVQIALTALEERPGAAAAPALLGLLRHPVRTVRVEAAYALARAGWRGHGADPEALWRETEAMFHRQGRFVDLLQRAVAISDALGRSAETETYLVELIRTHAQAAADGLHRRGRWLAEQQRHHDALQAYAEARNLAPEADEERLRLLFIDSADSLEALGQMDQAAGNWTHAAANFPPGSVPHAIAQARLAALGGDRDDAVRQLEDLAARLEKEPCMAEMLRRVRWSLRRLRGTAG
jgi:tetratricopeptide (TPR) repeat protein